MTPPPPDLLDRDPYAPFPEEPPGRASPSHPELFLDPSFSQAYEFDSYEGQIFERPHPPDWWPSPWLWPFSNGQWTWVNGQGDSLGFVEFEKRFLFTNPAISPFRIIPGFMTRYVSGPDTTDLPPQLTEFSVEVATTWQLQNGWVVDAGIRPGLNGDLNFINSDTFRLQGHVVASYPISPDTQGVLGFVYLDREDIPALPVAGFLWRPNPGVKMELVFPKPRLAVRVGGGPNNDGWLYVKGELGGNSWTIERANGDHDIATYRDIRLILGYETLLPNGMAAQFETGWVLSRKLSYNSGGPDFTPHDTFMIRAGFSF